MFYRNIVEFDFVSGEGLYHPRAGSLLCLAKIDASDGRRWRLLSVWVGVRGGRGPSTVEWPVSYCAELSDHNGHSLVTSRIVPIRWKMDWKWFLLYRTFLSAEYRYSPWVVWIESVIPERSVFENVVDFNLMSVSKVLELLSLWIESVIPAHNRLCRLNANNKSRTFLSWRSAGCRYSPWVVWIESVIPAKQWWVWFSIWWSWSYWVYESSQ